MSRSTTSGFPHRFWRAVAARLVLCTGLWLSATGASAAALPVALPPQLAADSALGREMTALMRDYSDRLVQVRVPYWLDVQSGQWREWTPHHEGLRRACREAPQPCLQLLQTQLGALERALVQASKLPRTAWFAAGVSAMSDLCAITPVPGEVDAQLFRLCGGQAGLTLAAALSWMEQGHDELFIAYYARHEQKHSSTLAWLAEQAVNDPVAREQRQRLEQHASPAAAARYFELLDQLPGATWAWLTQLAEAHTRQDYSRLLYASTNLARLGYRIGDTQQGDSWQRVAEIIISEQPQLSARMGCALQQEQVRLVVARDQAARRAPDPQAVIRLIEGDCPFSWTTIEYAHAGLRAGRAGDVALVIERALKACDTCAASRLRHLHDLLAIAHGGEAELQKQATRRLEESLAGRFNVAERQGTWALADALSAREGGRTSAYRLYVALDEQIHGERAFGMPNPSNLRNLARYDELSRLRARATVVQGEMLALERTEALRAQSLLQRLRLRRWQQAFADVRDDAARTRLDAELASLATLRKQLAALPAGASALEQALRTTVFAETANMEALYEQQYLETLASRKAEAADGMKRSAWLGTAGMSLFWHEQGRAIGRLPFQSLARDEGYLSWLRVPGGFVATLAVPDSVSGGTHRASNRFVAVPESMAATLALYRQLLQSGAGVRRGLAVATPLKNDTAGLVMQGIPVWRRSDGSFLAAVQAPPGAVRAKSMTEIGDAIFALLLEPVMGELGSLRRLTISPDGELSYLPFEALTRNGVSLLEGLDIAYVQSLAVHAELTERARSRRAGGTALLSLADPDYVMPAGVTVPGGSLPPAVTNLRWQPLPGTRAESEALRKLFPDSQQWLGSQASRSHLTSLQRKGALGRFRILHFATHGYVDDERSALVLSMAEGPARAYLQDTDVVELQLDSDLVLLSACDTGIGRNVSGEGVMGLPYAFLLAGNSNTLMSLWPVDDAGTAAFISAFMARTGKGADLLAALNDTKREFARGDHGRAYADPRIWAAFVQYGVGIRLGR